MSQLKILALQNAIRFLESASAQYRVIAENGVVYTNIPEPVPAPPVRTRKALKYPRGTLTSYFKPHIIHAGVGQIVFVPFKILSSEEFYKYPDAAIMGNFSSPEDQKQLNGSITAWCSENWGNQSYTTERTPEGINILRLK